jgi:hypothetical protein
MAHRLSSTREIAQVAAELGIHCGSDASTAIVKWCQANAARYMAEYGGCGTADELLAICAQKVGTRFEVIRTVEELNAVLRLWGARGETQFATLEQEFERRVLGITFRLRHPHPWECPFVSVIDSRGDRKHRAWFTKWHELGHLLILGSGSRESFCRTHSADVMRDPEEALVDRIAGACAFHPDLVRPLAGGPLTFHRIEAIRQQLCPDASIQSSNLGIVQAWSSPCLLLSCRYASRRDARGGTEALRATRILANEEARRIGMRVHPNMRVPDSSVIQRVFGTGSVLEAVEDLNWWSSSSGSRLPKLPLFVSASSRGEIVEALITSPS